MRRSDVSLLKAVASLFLEGRRGMLLAGAVLAGLTMLAGVALLGLSGWFITATAIAGLTTATALMFDVFAPSAGIRLLALGRTVTRYGERLTTHDATLGILAALRERLFRGWAQPGAARKLLERPATLLFRLTADVDALDSLYVRLLVPLFAAWMTALFAGVAVGMHDPLAGLLLAVVLMGAGLGIPLWLARRGQGLARRRAHASEALRARTVDLVSGQTDFIMTGQLARQHKAVLAADAALAKADDGLDRLDSLAGMGFGIVSAVIVAAMLLAVGLLSEAGQISAPAAAFVLLVALAALEPFSPLRRGALELGRSLLAVRRLGPRLQVQNHLQEQDHEPLADAARDDRIADGLVLRCENVRVRYPGAALPALDDFSLTLKPGESVAVVGASGTGKSTLLAVIAGEVKPEAGHVESLGYGWLTQRTELFCDSLRDNLRLAKPEADDATLWLALEDAGLAADIRALPLGLDTVLGEGGLGLSGGQGRRLVLARLLLRRAPLWLIDEATEGLDAATARDVLRRLKAAADNSQQAMLVATHLRREAELADRIIVMERGVMERGRIVSDARRGEQGFVRALEALRPD